MSIIFRDAGYCYPGAPSASVFGVSLTVADGQMMLLTGPTGCGKSTLLRLGAGLIQRHGQGTVSGSVEVSGADPAKLPPAIRAKYIGFVSQEPNDQLVAATVGDEVSFAMCSTGWSPERMAEAVPRMLSSVGLQIPESHPTGELSGGQTQRLVVAAALAAEAGVVLLDEPLAHLDPGGARSLLCRLRDLADRGVTVLLVEHRVEACLEFVDRVALMEEGRVVVDESVDDWRERQRSGHLKTDTPRAAVRGGLKSAASNERARDVVWGCAPIGLGTQSLAALTDARFVWPNRQTPALNGVNFSVSAGERVALLGANGAGKSTLLGALSGRLPGFSPPDCRSIAIPQDPDLALFCETVWEELAYAPSEQGATADEVDARVRRAAEVMEVSSLLARPPQALSRGQRLRVAVAAALTVAPDVLLLDEPTSGQDRLQVERMMRGLAADLETAAVVFATHDVGLALQWATRLVVMSHGKVVVSGEPRAVLAALPTDIAPTLLSAVVLPDSHQGDA